MKRLFQEYIYRRLEEASDMVVSPQEMLTQLAENPNCMAQAVFSAANIGSNALQNSLILAERFYQYERQGISTPEKELKNLEFLLHVAGMDVILDQTDVTSETELLSTIRAKLDLNKLTFLAAERSKNYPEHITHVTEIDERNQVVDGPKGRDQEFPINQLRECFESGSKCRVTIFSSK